MDHSEPKQWLVGWLMVLNVSPLLISFENEQEGKRVKKVGRWFTTTNALLDQILQADHVVGLIIGARQKF